MKKKIPLIIVIVALTFSATFLHAQHLFSVSQNDLSKENITLLKNQIINSEIIPLSLTKNNENKEVYPVAFSSVKNTKIIILNEQTGDHAVITPVATSLIEFQLAPFFIEELRQGALGNANYYLILETTNDFSVKNVASIPAIQSEVYIPQYFYGKKENVKKALPKDRQIVSIFKQRPHIISDFSDDIERQQYLAQLEEEMSYYVYMYQLSDGTLCTYDEYFNPDKEKKYRNVGGSLEFVLSGIMNETEYFATEYALELWGEQLASRVPVDISVDFLPLGDGVLGMTFFPQCFFDAATTTWYPAALWNQLEEYNASGMEDIKIIMNSKYRFYFGLDGSTDGRTDWVTVMIHEVAHGLGFGSQCHTDGSYFYGAHPVIYDRMLYQGLTGLCLTELTEPERAALIISNNLYAGRPGSNLLAAHNNIRVKMYAPTSYRPGSSAHHWDSNVNFPTFMKYAYERPLHTFNTRKIGLFLDLGWTRPVIEPNAVWVTFRANSGSGNMLPQQFLPEIAQKLKISPFSKRGYTFTGWNTLPDGTGDSYTDRELVTISDDLELYAQWEVNTYTLTFYAPGSVVSPTSKQVVYDAPIGEMPIPVRDGYEFDVWRIGVVSINEETAWNHVVDRTAVARWIPVVGINENVRVENLYPLQIIPNPAKNSIELRITNYELRVDRIEFYNVFGQLVKSVPFSGNVTEQGVSQNINISDLSAGMYVVKVGDQTAKLIVN